MIGLICFLNRDGTLKRLLWSNPTYLISTNDKITDLLENGKTIIPVLKFLKPTHRIQTEQGMLKHQGQLIPVNIVLQMMGEQIFLFLYNRKEGSADEIIEALVRAIESSCRDIPERKAYEYEQIQMINSQLINSQRELAKKNAIIRRLSKKYEDMAQRDPLTNLYNRYQYEEKIKQLIEQKPEEKGIFLFMDIDDFKAVNDQYGHQFGDEYLKEFTKRLEQLTIPDSVCFRIAGDEFGMYIHGNTYVGNVPFVPIWEKIQENVLSKPVIYNQAKKWISISVGIAIYGEHTSNISELVTDADYAMYVAKKSGKNRYVIYSETCRGPEQQLKEK